MDVDKQGGRPQNPDGRRTVFLSAHEHPLARMGVGDSSRPVSVREALCSRWSKHHTREVEPGLSGPPVQYRRLSVEVFFESPTPATINDVRKLVMTGWRVGEEEKEEWRLDWELLPLGRVGSEDHVSRAVVDPGRGLPRLVVLLALKAYYDVINDPQDKYVGILLEVEYRRFLQNYGIRTGSNVHDSFRQMWGNPTRKQAKITLYVCCLGGIFTRRPPFHRAWFLNLNPLTDIEFRYVNHTGEEGILSAEAGAATARRIWNNLIEGPEFLMPNRSVILESLCAGKKVVEGRGGPSVLDGRAGLLLKVICANPIADERIVALGTFVAPPFDFGQVSPEKNSFEGLLNWVRAQERPRLAIIGPPKIGKTIILAQIAREMSRMGNPRDLVPVFASHDEWRNWRSFDDVARYIVNWNCPRGTPIGLARSMLVQARSDIFFLLDGAELDYEGQLGKLLSRGDLLGESAVAVTCTPQVWRCLNLATAMTALELPYLTPDQTRRFAASMGLSMTGEIQDLLRAKPDWFRTPARLRKLKELYERAPDEDRSQQEWQNIGKQLGATSRHHSISRHVDATDRSYDATPIEEETEATLPHGNRLLITGRSPDAVQRMYLHILQQRMLAADLDIRLDVEFGEEDVDGILEANINSKVLLSCAWVADVERACLLRRAVEGLLAQGHEVEVLVAGSKLLWDESIKKDSGFWGTFVRHGTKTASETTRDARMMTQLEAIQQALPGLARQLASSDFVSLCRRLREFCREVVQDMGSEAVAVAMDELLGRLESRTPAFAVAVRGSELGTAAAPVSDEAVKALASSLGNEAERQLALNQPDLDRESRQHGDPEKWLFEKMTPLLRERAARVRDYCEERLEVLHAQAAGRCGISSGIGHSKRVLRLSADLLRAFEAGFSDPFPYYAMYVATYCHDLGMIVRKGEDLGNATLLSQVRDTHGLRTLTAILGDRTQGILPAWRAMGFGSEQEAAVIAQVCAVHQRAYSEDLRRMPASQPLFIDGQSRMVSPLTLAALLRLANALDCHPNRLPSSDCLARLSIGSREQHDYLKHELVENVTIDREGKIRVAMWVRYVYPPTWRAVEQVRAGLETEMAFATEILKLCGLRLPPPQFKEDEALFVEPHPYWGEGDTQPSEK